MAKLTEPGYYCRTCKSVKNFGKYSCKTCSYAYSNNFKRAREYDHGYQVRKERRQKLKSTDDRLRTLYGRIRDRYVEAGYLPAPEKVIFRWKRGQGGHGGTCWKSKKEIAIGSIYKYAFKWNTKQEENATWCTDNFNNVKREDLVRLMIHEAVHLRLAHHRKSFKQKVEEIEARYKVEHNEELYADLVEGQPKKEV